MSKVTDFLEKNKPTNPSKWRETALWRRENAKWLNYSRFITIKIMQAMDEQSVTQSILAQRMNCSQQYVSNLLKGSSNMTLETIARIEDALQIDILRTAFTYVSGYSEIENPGISYLSDSEPQ